MCKKKYDPKWYLDSIDAVVDSIDISIAYLNSAEKSLKETQRNYCVITIEKYNKLRDRVLALKKAVPQSHPPIVHNLEFLRRCIQEDRANLEINFFCENAVSSMEDSVFAEGEAWLCEAEKIVNDPPKDAKIPNDALCGFLFLKKEDRKHGNQLQKVEEYKTFLRDLVELINQTFVQRESWLNYYAKSIDACDAEITAAKNETKALDAKRKGEISEAEYVFESEKNEAKIIALEEKKQFLRSSFESVKMPYLSLKHIWEATIEPKVEALLDATRVGVLIRIYAKAAESLKCFQGYLLGMDGDNGEYRDFSLLQDFLESFETDLSEQHLESLAIETELIRSCLIGTKPNYEEESSSEASSAFDVLHSASEALFAEKVDENDSNDKDHSTEQ